MGDDLKQKLALSQARCKRLKKARAEAESVLELKSRELFDANQALESTFIGQMSHEVRTPLNAIIGLSEILLTSKLDDAQADYVDTIHNGAKSLIVLLNDMLDITKIEAGRVDINPQAENTHRVHKNIVAMFDLEAKNKGLNLELKIDNSVQAKYW